MYNLRLPTALAPALVLMVYRTVPMDRLLDLLFCVLDLLRNGLLVVRVSQHLDVDLDVGSSNVMYGL